MLGEFQDPLISYTELAAGMVRLEGESQKRRRHV